MELTVDDVEAVRQVLYRYCRGLDRMDEDMVSGCFTPDAVVDYLTIFEGSATAFVEEVWSRHRAHQRHSHHIANVLVERDGEELVSEAYVSVTLWTETEPGRVVERLVRGRYLDRWAHGERGWRIRERTFVADHRSEHPLGAEAQGALLSHATRDEHDPSWSVVGAAHADGRAAPSGVARLLVLREIEELKARYLHGIDRNAWSEVAACLTPDVEVSYASGAFHHVGVDRVIEFLRGTSVAATTCGSSHVATNPVIELLGPDRARGTWRLTDLVHDREKGSLLVGSAIYHDQYRRTEAGWRIAATGYERLLEVRIPA